MEKLEQYAQVLAIIILFVAKLIVTKISKHRHNKKKQ